MDASELALIPDLRLVGATRTDIISGAPCAHGEEPLHIALTACTPENLHREQHLHTLLPRCVLTRLIGSVLAEIRHAEGDAAAQAFRDRTEAEATTAYTALREAFRCPRCRKTSHHPDDKRHGYCANCHAYTAAPGGQ